MSKFTDKQIKELIRQAGDQFTLSASHKSAMRFHLLDVIKSGEPRTSKQHISHILNPRRFAMPLIPIIIAAIVALGGGTTALANTAKPGDALYPIDQWVEQIQERLTTNVEARARLFAKLSEERLVELSSLESTNIAKLTETAKARWEEHRQEAIERLNTSMERVSANQDKFEERLKVATDPDEKAILEKIIAHLDEVKAKREAKLAELETKTFPGRLKPELKEALKEAREEHKRELEQIREQAKQEWEELRETQKQIREQQRENAKTNSSNDNEDEDEDEDKSDDNSTPSTSGSTGNTSNQVTLEARVPRDENGNIDWDLYDSDHDGIPDKWDGLPDWEPHTMIASR